MRLFFWLKIEVVGLVLPLALSGQIVQGTVTDSAAGVPIPEATVFLVDLTGQFVDQTTTHVDGQFLLYSSVAGDFRIRVQANGFAPTMFPEFSLRAEESRAFRLLMAPRTETRAMSGADIINSVCEQGAAVGESGTILGFVRNQDGEPVSGAEVILSWSPVASQLRDLVQVDVIDDVRVAVATDSTGFYAACGVPSQTTINFLAVGGDLLSDFSAVRFTTGAVEHRGILHDSSDRLWYQDLNVVPQEMHTGIVEGTIRGEDTGSPIADGQIELLGTGRSTLTDSSGHFLLDHVPNGPAKLRIRTVGYRVSDVPITLRPDSALILDSVFLTKGPIELTPIEVFGAAPEARRPLDDFFRRRERNVGQFITRDEFLEQGNPQVPTDVLRRLAGVKITPNPKYDGRLEEPRFLIVMVRNQARASFGLNSAPGCPPLAFLDGHYLGRTSSFDVDALINMDHLQAVEAYASTASMPVEFNRTGATCGVVAFWTR